MVAEVERIYNLFTCVLEEGGGDGGSLTLLTAKEIISLFNAVNMTLDTISYASETFTECIECTTLFVSHANKSTKGSLDS